MTTDSSLSTEKQSLPATPELQRLEAFIGNWRTEGRTIAQPDSPAVRALTSDVYEWLPGGHFIEHRWDGHVGDAEVHGIEMIGIDKNTGSYRTYFFDNDGNSGSEALTVNGRTWTWLGQHVMGEDWHRCTSVVSDDGDTMTAKHERSRDGKVWTPWMDVTLRRQAGHTTST